MRVERVAGAADELLTGELPVGLAEPVVVMCDLTATTLILGSSQRIDAVVDTTALESAQICVARRRSGGAAVLLRPGGHIWIDLLLPVADPRWSDDVVQASFWLGDTWAAALRSLGVEANVHRGALEKTRWGKLVCFGALGPGEVVVGGKKVVGISQRRTRHGARFQCLVHEYWDPAALLNLLALTPDEREEAMAELVGAAAGVGVPLNELADAFVERVTN